MSRLLCLHSRRRASCGMLFVLLFALMLAPASPTFAVPIAPPVSDSAQSPTSDLSSLPLAFIPNAGQSDAKVRFITSAKGSTIFFTPNEVVFALASPAFVAASHEPGRVPRDIDHLKRLAAASKEPLTVLRMAFLGANAEATLVGTAVQPGVTNYLLGDDPHTWLTNLPTYAGVGYHGLYAGIDLQYAGTGGQFKSTYLVAPGADPTQLHWNYAGANNVMIDNAGNLVIALAPPRGRAHEDRTLTEHAPVAWQDIAGQRVPVAAAYALHADGSIGFTLGQYDPSSALTIDPILTYSSYLGGNGSDSADAIAVGSDGSIYVTGNTQSTNFPTTAPFQGAFGGNQDAFVTKIQNGVRVYSTYWGGNDYDTSAGIAVDSSNQIYITGNTASTNLTWPNAYDNSLSGFNDAYLVKFNAAGSAVLYATLLGGSSTEIGYDIAVSGSKASIVGVTN